MQPVLSIICNEFTTRMFCYYHAVSINAIKSFRSVLQQQKWLNVSYDKELEKIDLETKLGNYKNY